MSFFDYLKNIFLILIFLQLAPTLVESIRKQYGRYIMPRTRVALIEMKGVLYSSDHYTKYLNKYFKNKDIKAILLKMECPGSASGTAQAIFNEIIMLKKKYPSKPIVTLVENICASGGYYIACATDAIIAPPSALLGSIGANLPYLFQLQEFMEQYKIKYESITAGKYKGAIDPFKMITPADKEMLQHVIDDTYDQFMQDVVKTRKVSMNNKNEWAEGKLFTGRQAMKLGLIDIVGSGHNARELLKDKALIKGEVEWVRPTKKTSLWSLFGGRRDEDDSTTMFSLFASKLSSALKTKRIF